MRIQGYYEGQEIGKAVTAFGDNDAVATSLETLWAAGATYSYPAAAAASTIVSDSANDDGSPVGTGARTVRITGVDSAANGYAELTEAVTLNGTGAVTLANQYLRINSVEVVTYGSTGGNVGTLTVAVGATTVATVRPAENRSSQAVYTVPLLAAAERGESTSTCLLASLYAAAAIAATVELWVRLPGEALAMRLRYAVASQLPVDLMPPLLLDPGTDLEIRAKTGSSGLVTGTLGLVWV